MHAGPEAPDDRPTRVGVDVGGTFTDLILHDPRSGPRVVKVPTSPAAPEDGVLEAVARGLPPDALHGARAFVHGTTVGLNALLTRTGAVVGLITTDGFRDVLEIRRGDRADPYDLLWPVPAPLVPRRLRIGVRERVLADATVQLPLVDDDVRAALDVFRAERVSAVAICFINGYANPVNELRAAELLRAAGFDGPIALSHQVSGEYREYERTSTTAVDAFVQGVLGGYVSRLDDGLRAAGFGGDALMTCSGGGALTFGEVRARPFETIMSGPVAGVQAAAALGRTLGLRSVITADVGGTSFDTSLIDGGELPLRFAGEIDGMPIQAPWVDVRSIGAGGGSIAHVDAGGLLRVGPRSAGSAPGPACYGRGGTEPTVTDAMALLGMLGAGVLAGGLRLDVAAAESALEPISAQLGQSVEEVARGMLAITAAHMADAIREITVERGEDPREAAIMAFGGAGPLFGTLLADELDVGTVVVPPLAGNFSAWGLLGSDLVRSAARTRVTPLDADGLARVGEIAVELFDGLVAGGAEGVREVRLDMRYVGQEHTLTIELPAAAAGTGLGIALDALADRFGREYERTFGHTMAARVEVVTVRASMRLALADSDDALRAPEGGDATADGTAEAYSFRRGARVPFALHRRENLPAGAEVAGPAIVSEEITTIYLDDGFRLRVDDGGSLIVTGGLPHAAR
ncbi:hydantoinase/oxoprolinase family protein [Conexibacter woesei]|uniref:5-oxoprolinase (ATP-hydrolyzing) n=1 Tax=Conexibacter woesei (strain DSM 14684 / CCUG 47730 / CIP 108061 / JCM 11494 / NBRC 100937 / ID131577) TaxID=469383 RepID=D3F5G6_CONWI|nr:hydantoinase/oxoprolinase family protein [Conexibacter woesei]ADB50633.1 5-oxoprolinase (ATP-hydrolyzing) [Conexibacter woesei DSM 14684]